MENLRAGLKAKQERLAKGDKFGRIYKFNGSSDYNFYLISNTLRFKVYEQRDSEDIDRLVGYEVHKCKGSKYEWWKSPKTLERVSELTTEPLITEAVRTYTSKL